MTKKKNIEVPRSNEVHLKVITTKKHKRKLRIQEPGKRIRYVKFRKTKEQSYNYDLDRQEKKKFKEAENKRTHYIARQKETTPEKSPYTKTQSRYIYVTQDSNGHTFTISSTQLIHSARNSRERQILYDAIRDRYSAGDSQPSGKLQLMMTYDAMTGNRILGGL